MTTALDELTDQVRKNTSIIASAKALIAGIAERIANAGTDGTKLAALTAELRSADDDLSAAILSNTPQAPEVAPPPAA